MSSIGPNAVIQTLRALRELEPDDGATQISLQAGLGGPPPSAMIPEAVFMRLIRCVRDALPAERSEAVLRRAGEYTAAYVAAHRIPAAVRTGLRFLPARPAVQLLLSAFEKHAWTFAGSGRFRAEGPYPPTLVLEGCPTCRAESADGHGAHAGAYYEAAFEGLLKLAHPRVRVRETSCQAAHAPHCRFEISFTTPVAD